jgi:hypothetical protein
VGEYALVEIGISQIISLFTQFFFSEIMVMGLGWDCVVKLG